VGSAAGCAIIRAMENPTLPLPLGVQKDIYTPSRLNREVRGRLEKAYQLIWLEGEISNLGRPSSGHLYFSLKDSNAQVRCAMFRGKNVSLSFQPEDGQKVLVRAQVSLYEARGEFQLIVQEMEEAGAGALRRAFEALKAKLEKEGLFDAAAKKTLPAAPARIGVITSPTGAALRDVLTALRRRFPVARVLVYPVPVQGKDAAPEITRMIGLASRQGVCDVLILCRGGGSLEDLWPFNEESVARAVFDCRIPLVAGVGHETDFTIAEFAADQRAPTPTAAAELVTPDGVQLLRRLEKAARGLSQATTQALLQRAQQVDWLQGRLVQQHPGSRLQDWKERLAGFRARMQQAQRVALSRQGERRDGLDARLRAADPRRLYYEKFSQSLRSLEGRLGTAHRAVLQNLGQRLEAGLRQLNAVNPLATLDRGYAILKTVPEGALLRSSLAIGVGDKMEARLVDGSLLCRVEEQRPDEPRDQDQAGSEPDLGKN